MTTYMLEQRLPLPVDPERVAYVKRMMKFEAAKHIASLLEDNKPVAIEIEESEHTYTSRMNPTSPFDPFNSSLVLQLVLKQTPVTLIDRRAIYRDITPAPDYLKWNEALNKEVCRGLNIPSSVLYPPKTLFQRLSSWWKEMQKPMPYDGPRG